MNTSEYYVYHLINSLSGNTFYVGKGKGNRAYQHERDAIKGEQSYKCNYIRSLLKKGGEVVVIKVFQTDCQRSAYSFEKKEIERIGLDNLTNVQPGGLLSQEAVDRLLERKAKSAQDIKALEREATRQKVLANGTMKYWYSLAKRLESVGLELMFPMGTGHKLGSNSLIGLVESLLSCDDLKGYADGATNEVFRQIEGCYLHSNGRG